MRDAGASGLWFRVFLWGGFGILVCLGAVFTVQPSGAQALNPKAPKPEGFVGARGLRFRVLGFRVLQLRVLGCRVQGLRG